MKVRIVAEGSTYINFSDLSLGDYFFSPSGNLVLATSVPVGSSSGEGYCFKEEKFLFFCPDDEVQRAKVTEATFKVGG